jgi:hypothetical protein
MSGDGFWLTQHAKVMPPLDAKVQAFWLSDHPLPINSASPSAPPSWSKLVSLHEWETKALSLAAPGGMSAFCFHVILKSSLIKHAFQAV